MPVLTRGMARKRNFESCSNSNDSDNEDVYSCGDESDVTLTKRSYKSRYCRGEFKYRNIHIGDERYVEGYLVSDNEEEYEDDDDEEVHMSLEKHHLYTRQDLLNNIDRPRQFENMMNRVSSFELAKFVCFLLDTQNLRNINKVLQVTLDKMNEHNDCCNKVIMELNLEARCMCLRFGYVMMWIW